MILWLKFFFQGNPLDNPNNMSLIESMTASGHLDSPAVQAPPSYESLGYSEPVNSVFNKVGIMFYHAKSLHFASIMIILFLIEIPLFPLKYIMRT